MSGLSLSITDLLDFFLELNRCVGFLIHVVVQAPTDSDTGGESDSLVVSPASGAARAHTQWHAPGGPSGVNSTRLGESSAREPIHSAAGVVEEMTCGGSGGGVVLAQVTAPVNVVRISPD